MVLWGGLVVAGAPVSEVATQPSALPSSVTLAIDTYNKKVAAIRKQAEEDIAKERVLLEKALQQQIAVALRSSKTALADAIKAKLAAATEQVPPESAENNQTDVIINRKKFRIVKQAVTWVEAEKRCRAMGGSLASVRNVTENVALAKALNQVGIPVAWIGLSAKKKRNWSWSNGNLLVYQGWGSREQPGRKELADSVAGLESNGAWTAYDTEDTFPFICQLPNK